jgi:hypothetical protein
MPASSHARPSPARLLAWATLGGLLLAVPARAEDPPSPPPAAPPAPAPAPAPTPGTPLPEGGLPARGSPGWTAWRENTWRAPTAEDWKKPVLLKFQRSWDDAVAVAREEGRPILVCINMDGEIASEHYAGVRYRQPEIAALYEPYVCVVASVYRHNPRDYDDDGHRIPCPRFGSVTCGEHIAIEPVVFEKFCDGQRVAPRHIAVELDGKESYDVFYANDTQSVFQAIRDGIEKRPPLPARAVRGDRPVLERVGSREASDRAAVEAAYAKGDEASRRALLEAAAKYADADPLDVLRLAVFGLDPELSRTARQALAKVETPAATELVSEALRVPMPAEEKEALVAALRRLGGKSELARWLAVVHQGLASSSGAVDVARWGSAPAAGGDGVPRAEGGGVYGAVESREAAARERPKDPEAQLALAEAALVVSLEPRENLSDDPKVARLVSRAMLAAARSGAAEAERLGAKGWRLDAVAALAAYYSGEKADAYARAAVAAKELPPGDGTWTSMALLSVFAEGRWQAMRKAVKDKTDFPPEWLADVNSAYAVLLAHPLGTTGQVLWHQDMLDWLGAGTQATRVLERGLERFPDAPEIHARLREYVLRRKGPAALEATYDALAASGKATPGLPYYAGLASAAAGDSLRRLRRGDAALEAYGRALARWERLAASDARWKPATSTAAATVHAARARVAFEAKDDEKAVEEMVAAFAASPSAAGTKDGLGVEPGDTARALLARLEGAKRDDLAKRLREAMSAVDPDLLRPAEGE